MYQPGSPGARLFRPALCCDCPNNLGPLLRTAQTIFDHSLKFLIQQAPEAVCHLIGLDVRHHQISREDPNIQVGELRADHVFRIKRDGQPDFVLYIEYQTVPDRRALRAWELKYALLSY
jgi:hypothetical protein